MDAEGTADRAGVGDAAREGRDRDGHARSAQGADENAFAVRRNHAVVADAAREGAAADRDRRARARDHAFAVEADAARDRAGRDDGAREGAVAEGDATRR